MYVACVPVAPRYAICSSRLVRKRLLSEFSSEATKLPSYQQASSSRPYAVRCFLVLLVGFHWTDTEKLFRSRTKGPGKHQC
ncbi:uncharacterized protein PGTG_22170 [Puccinia graminis f. sp. tritici CRL 75-36-700-3]|uniref:Uncharacterized protein n=1 Tax=Puccinia graminis f. sp. tritici (strain CRL 75-36-700-3 / race SCCL) TaxID=418459 RepID=H6QTN9_PUCGT|nr:uncharacterized protein PGTG_22170 [Puccinia graminis f. sp. tritici CRL 75-36-700-3]EHS64254.1 hypothetical protein PGTG_22170 [Puccinia graminis f. sp. tritici CRL 75-36-700-3]